MASVCAAKHSGSEGRFHKQSRTFTLNTDISGSDSTEPFCPKNIWSDKDNVTCTVHSNGVRTRVTVHSIQHVSVGNGFTISFKGTVSNITRHLTLFST